ncbi:unnamed protein product [Coregonus sp. 'balchen']|nr:unnamed protein product [Coregonus sp. 'balchen']
MKLKQFLLRYYPPGIILEYEKGGALKSKSIDVLDLSPEWDRHQGVNIRDQEVGATDHSIMHRPSQTLDPQTAGETGSAGQRRFYLFKALKAHILPLTNVVFNKSGSRDKIATGSFDKTCRLWSAEMGKCFHTFQGHTAEIDRQQFPPACGHTVWLCVPEREFCVLLYPSSLPLLYPFFFNYSYISHSAEVISLSFNTVGDQLVTGSFDHTVSLWDVPSGRRVHTLIGHRGEISSVQFNWDCSLIITGSMDKSCRRGKHNHCVVRALTKLVIFVNGF